MESLKVLMAVVFAASLVGNASAADEIKKTVTGTGQAEKEQVRRMVLALLGAGGARLALDAADAAAAALTHGFRTAAGRRATRAGTGSAAVRPRVAG